MKHYIGIDLGTSAMKLILLREDGVICNTVSKEYPIAFPKPGWSEQNPEDWKAALLRRGSGTDPWDESSGILPESAAQADARPGGSG